MMRRACARVVSSAARTRGRDVASYGVTINVIGGTTTATTTATAPAAAASAAVWANSQTRRAYCHDAAALSPFDAAAHGMPERDKFLFDTNGFVVVKNVFSKEDLARFHGAIDAHADQIHERKGQLRLTAAKTPLSGDGKTGRKVGAVHVQCKAPGVFNPCTYEVIKNISSLYCIHTQLVKPLLSHATCTAATARWGSAG
jgi:hypothetical protein